MRDWRYTLAAQRGTLIALGLFMGLFALYVAKHPAGFTANVVQTAANKGAILAFVAMAQTFVVLTAGIDLSAGMTFTFTNCLGSYIVAGSTPTALLGCLGVLVAGSVCGMLNGLIVIYGRLQPIVTTVATGSIYYGLALWLRPQPGNSDNFNSDIADLMTGKTFGVVPSALVVLLAVVLVVWVPFRRSTMGRAVYATGSSEVAAYMSGVPTQQAKFWAYALSGLLASVGGLYLSFITYSGEANFANGGAYTLYSIAAVVLGGVSLFGGVGSAIGAIFGALAFRTIGDLMFVFELDPLFQPLFQGVVLLLAVCVGAARLFRIRNRLDLFA